MSGPVLVELFAGAGGIGLGFARAGVRTVAWSEVEPHACAVMRHHHPDAVELGDVKGVTGERIRTLAGSDDIVLAGGFPCQDVSIAGRRAGLAGERSGLFFEFARIVGELSPRWVVVENVPGLLTSNGGADFAAVLRTLAGLGLALAWRTVDAQHFGPPQRRRRIFIVGRSAACDCGPRAVLDLPEGGCGNPAQGITPRTVLAPGVGVGARGAGGERGFSTSGRGWWNEGIGTLRSGGDGMNPGDPEKSGVVVSEGFRASDQGSDASEDGTGRGTPIIAFSAKDDGRDAGEVAPTLRAMGHDESHANGGGQLAVAFHMIQDPISSEVSPALGAASTGMGVAYQCQGGNVGPMGTLRSGGHEGSGVPFTVAVHPTQTPVHGDELSPTLGATSRGMAVLPVRTSVRRLTPTECERLMGWDDDWTARGVRPDGTAYELSDSARYRLCGNGVVAPVALWIGARLLACQGMPANAPCEGVPS